MTALRARLGELLAEATRDLGESHEVTMYLRSALMALERLEKGGKTHGK